MPCYDERQWTLYQGNLMHRICVYCGARHGNRPEYGELARQVGRALAERGLGLVYGGGNVGLMGELANAMLAVGGEVIGVIPRVLMGKEMVHEGLSELHRVGTMHERKALMEELADGFVALPGGVGTLDELFEILSWAQLGLHDKPVGLLDCQDYYQSLLRFLRHTVVSGLVSQTRLDGLWVERDPNTLLDRFAAHLPAATQQWITRENI